MASRERGASGVLILIILILVIVGFLASWVLYRVTSGGDDRNETQRRLAVAASALEQFAAANARLPCPTDPTAATGDEVQASAATCTFGEGTIPWKTLGMKSDDAFDAWGRKLSYRVYTGNAGSLTQPGGVSMVECDTIEPTAGNRTAVAASLGGLCVSNADPYMRSTTPAKFLQNKGLTLTEFGVVHNDVAYVVISHGATGLGGYTASGARLDMPAGDERDNTRETGSFTIKAFSDPDTGVNTGQHFDDLLVYRTLPDLVKRAGLEARNWPENITTVTFDNASVSAAAGHAVVAGDVGTATLDFGDARVSGFSGGTTPTNIAFDDTIGSPARDGIGVVGNGGNLMSSAGGEFIKVQFVAKASSFAITLNDFGKYPSGSLTYTENVQFTFFNGASVVGSPIVKAGCNTDGGLASFSITPSGDFDAVEIRPVDATSASLGTNVSAFLVSEVQSCTATVGSCTTSLANVSNTCS